MITAIGIAYVMRHAIKVRKKPELSITYQTDIELRKEYGVGKKVEMTGRRKVAMFAFLICFAILIVGALKFSWGLIEIGTMFLITGLLVGFICKLSLTEICDKFSEGLSAFIGAALISGFASGITIGFGKRKDYRYYHQCGSTAGSGSAPVSGRSRDADYAAAF